MSSEELLDFFVYLFEQDVEDQMWEVWLHKPIEQTFADFKKSILKKTNDNRMSQEEEETNIEKALSILNMSVKEVGE